MWGFPKVGVSSGGPYYKGILLFGGLYSGPLIMIIVNPIQGFGM